MMQNNCPARSRGSVQLRQWAVGRGSTNHALDTKPILLALHFSTVKGVCALSAA